MTGTLVTHLWQATWCGAVIWMLAFLLRRNRAEVRFWLWFSASLKLLIPFAVLTVVGGYLAETAPTQRVVARMAGPAAPPTLSRISQSLPEVATVVPGEEAPSWVGHLLAAIWVTGFTSIAVMRFRGWLRVKKALESSTESSIAVNAAVPVRVSAGLLEPGVVGWWRPVLLLPVGIQERLTPPQLEAVLTHELCHARRRDNLFSAIHMIAEAVFWFHPLVWWIGAKLMEERERACDEEVVRLGNEPRVYAAAIVRVCREYVESPLVCVSGVTGANIRKRIEVIMTNRDVLPLTVSRKLALAGAGIAVLAVPVVLGIFHTPGVWAQSGSVGRPKFREVSIRRCGGEAPVPGTKLGHERAWSPGTVKTGCMPLVEPSDNLGLIQAAYVRFGMGQVPAAWPAILPVEGGPGWIRSERYEITAKADGNPSEEMMRGPMMQALLEDRFQLRIRRDSRTVPVYALRLAPGGLQLTPFQGGTCLAAPAGATPAPAPEGQRYCKVYAGIQPPAVRGEGATMAELSQLLSLVLDRAVVDETGMGGKWDISLKFAADGMTPRYLPGGDLAPLAREEPGSLPISEAIRRLGLQLEPADGQREFLVIDQMERPGAMR